MHRPCSTQPGQVDLAVAGFPCVSISALTTTPGSILDEGCESGKGWNGLYRYVRRHRPGMVVIENVKMLYAKRAAEQQESS